MSSLLSVNDYWIKSGFCKIITQTPDVFIKEENLKRGKFMTLQSACICEKCEILHVTHAIMDDHESKYFNKHQCNCPLCNYVHNNYYKEFGCEKSTRRID